MKVVVALLLLAILAVAQAKSFKSAINTNHFVTEKEARKHWQMMQHEKKPTGSLVDTNTSWLPYNIYFRGVSSDTPQGSNDYVINIYEPTGPQTVAALSIDAELVFHPQDGVPYNPANLYLCSAAVVFVIQTAQQPPQIVQLEPGNAQQYPIPNDVDPIPRLPLYPAQDDVFWGETYLIRDLNKVYKFEWSSLDDPRWSGQQIVMNEPLQIRVAYALPATRPGYPAELVPFANECGGFDIIGTMNYAYKFP